MKHDTSLQLYFHPLSSFCWKALIGFYESGIVFEPHFVDFSDDASRAAFLKLSPLGKIPVLHEPGTGQTIPEATTILEYLADTDPRARWLLPAATDEARAVRLRDRIFDLHVQVPMQKIVGDRNRPAGERDPNGAEAAKTSLATALKFVEAKLASAEWPAGGPLTMADCAAFPALHYANRLSALDSTYPTCARYLQTLTRRASIARVLFEAQPYAHMFPG